MENQEVIDKLIDYIDKAILKNSVSNRHVAAVLAFLNEKCEKNDIVELEKKFLRKDQSDETNFLTSFNAGIAIGKDKKEVLDIIRYTDPVTSVTDTSVYTSLMVDKRFETELGDLDGKYICKYKEDSTLYPVDFMGGLSINSKRIGDVIRYCDDPRAIATDTSVYTSLMVDKRFETELGDLDGKYICKYKEDSTLYPVDFMCGLSINSKRVGDVIRYYDAIKPVSTDANIYSALMTDQRIEEEFEGLDDRYIRKDKKDFAHKHITFEEGVTVYELAELMNLDVKNLAIIAKAVVSILRSSKFVDGFSGEGYQIWQDIASGDWNLTIDRVTVRKVMTIYELIVQKIRSVGGMVVVSAANGKVKSIEKIGNQYLFTFEDTNQFEANDLMRCQVFTGKDIKYYWVKVASVSGESVIVPVSEFNGIVPNAGDECVLMGNTTNKRRQSLIIISATEDGQPRFDCLNGVKNKSFDGCLMVRVGNLDGISDSNFPADMQPSGHGIYGNNCFLTGVFVLSNGKDVMTMFAIMEGMIKAEISAVRNEVNSKDNYLSNASFAENLLNWSGNNNIRVFSVSNKLLTFNSNFYARKQNFANIVQETGRNVLRLKNSTITQQRSDYALIPEFESFEQVDADGNALLDEEGNPVLLKRPRMFYVSFKCMVKRAGVLRVYFSGESTEGFEEYKVKENIDFEDYINISEGFYTFEIPGKWNGTGNFSLSFSGDMYLYSLALADNPLAELEERFNMRYEATDKKIQANLDEIKKTGTKLEEYHSQFLLTARNLEIKFTEDLSDTESRITSAYKSYVNLTARDLRIEFSADISNTESRITEAYTSAISLSAKGLQTKFTADITNLEAGITSAYKSYVNLTAQNLEAGFTEDLTDLRTGVTEAYKAAIEVSARGLRADFNSSISDLDGKLTTHTGSFHVTSDKISAMVTATDNINKTISSAGWITTADGNKLWATITTVDALGNKLTSHEGKFHVTASEISGIVTRVDTAESGISGINQRISSAGWITTADGNKLWATTSQYNALNQVVSTHTGSFHVTATKINSMVESIDDTGRKFSAITQTVGEIRMDVNDVSGKYANLSLKVDAISAVVGDGSTGSFSEFLQTVNEISASVTAVKDGLNAHTGKFHVTATEISSMVSRIDGVEEGVTGINQRISSAGWITTADGNKLWATITTVDALGNKLTSHEGKFHVTASEISGIVTRVDTAESGISGINQRISSAGWITTADGNKLWATTTQYNALNQVVSDHTSRFHVTSDEISAMVTATDNINKTISNAGWITQSNGNTWWASKGTETTAANAAKSAIDAATAAANAMSKANSAYDIADAAATALVQTNSSISAIAGRFNADGTLKEGAGWVTTADANTSWVKKNGIISAINQSAETIAIDARYINLNGVITANGCFKINLDGSIEATGGTIGGININRNGLGANVEGLFENYTNYMGLDNRKIWFRWGWNTNLDGFFRYESLNTDIGPGYINVKAKGSSIPTQEVANFMSGNYGLKINERGVFKTSDGGTTWIQL